MKNTIFSRSERRAFTLIELLIVVAIIAILAAIAVPNFLEAQTRSKTSRLYSDMRSVKTALEAYRVDTNKYPETDFGTGVFENTGGAGMFRLTTPIAYITSIPVSPFQEDRMGSGATPKHSNTQKIPLYVRALGVPGKGQYEAGFAAGTGLDNDYLIDRLVYLLGQASVTPVNFEVVSKGFYQMKSVGPDNDDDRQGGVSTGIASARVYDPTNGTISSGDIVTYQDTEIPARQRPL